MAKHYQMYFGCLKGHFFIPLYTDLNGISEVGQYETLKTTTYFSQINLLCQLLKGKMLKLGASLESLFLFSPDLTVGQPQEESVGILLSVLGVTGKTHRRAIVRLLQISIKLFCSILLMYLHLQKEEEEKRLENSFSTLNL